MKKRYDLNKAAKVGQMICCPVCGKEFIKKQYSQAFCCLGCKDRYHNTIKGNKHKETSKNFGVGKCALCGKSFTKQHPKQRFCCDRHRYRYHNINNPRGWQLIDMEYEKAELIELIEESYYFQSENSLNFNRGMERLEKMSLQELRQKYSIIARAEFEDEMDYLSELNV
jgi:hypothetical protein